MIDSRKVHYFNIEPRHFREYPQVEDPQQEWNPTPPPQSDMDTIERIFNALGTRREGCYVNFDGTEEWKTLEEYREPAGMVSDLKRKHGA